MISNIITFVRTGFTLPLFLILAYGGGDLRWIALALFLGAGALDMADGIVARRLNETSAFGAMIDLIGDRLLTLAALLGLLAAGALQGLTLVAAAILIARCVIVASLNEALPGQLELKVSVVEKIKIAASFLGTALFIAPTVVPGQTDLAGVALGFAALVTCFTLLDYWRRAVRAFQHPNSSR